MITSRRSFITGLVSLVAAPAIVKVNSLMPVKSYMEEAYRITRENLNNSLYGDLVAATNRAFVPRLFVQVYKADRSIRLIRC